MHPSPSPCHPNHLLHHLGSDKIQGSHCHSSFSTCCNKITKQRCIIKYFRSLIVSPVSFASKTHASMKAFLVHWRSRWYPLPNPMMVSWAWRRFCFEKRCANYESAVHHRLHSFKRALSDRLKDHWTEEIPPCRYTRFICHPKKGPF